MLKKGSALRPSGGNFDHCGRRGNGNFNRQA